MGTNRLAFAALALLAATPAPAYWEYGHETIARIAYAHVRPATRTAIHRLLAHSADLATPTCPANTIATASIWPDCIKTLKQRFSYAYAWHYQDVDICRPFDLKAACKDGNCVSAQITRNTTLLADRSLPPRERLMALAFLVHFVGDLHQPLHAGEHDDQGGNKVKAVYGVGGPNTNLHSIWDGYLAERAISTPPAIEGTSDEAAGTVEDWSRENWEVARATAYALLVGDPCKASESRSTLDEAKIRAAIPVLRMQVSRGGMRLARLLDEALN